LGKSWAKVSRKHHKTILEQYWNNTETNIESAGRKAIFSPLDALPDLNLILSDCQTVQQFLKDSP
jgi:hypothetical protein